MDTHVGSVDGPSRAADNGAMGCPASAPGCPMTSSCPDPAAVSAGEASLGRHLARRLVQVGVSDVFAVPGDFNLTLLDHLIAEPGLRLVGCCNELNAGYAADGYARARGVGACAVTFTVGGLSVLNAIAGAYSENLPVICIAGGPNSNDYGTNRILHHTIGLPDFSQELRCFQTVTCHQAVVTNLDDAHEQIDTAIATALRESKPVYLSISCNLPGLPHPTFSRDPVTFFLAPRCPSLLLVHRIFLDHETFPPKSPAIVTLLCLDSSAICRDHKISSPTKKCLVRCRRSLHPPPQRSSRPISPPPPSARSSSRRTPGRRRRPRRRRSASSSRRPTPRTPSWSITAMSPSRRSSPRPSPGGPGPGSATSTSRRTRRIRPPPPRPLPQPLLRRDPRRDHRDSEPARAVSCGQLAVREIPPGIGNLTYLQALDLSHNRLSGVVPAGLADCFQLLYLRLGGNQLSGALRPELDALDSLKVLDLSNNRISGEIPLPLAGCRSLEVVNLSGNEITGELSGAVAKWLSLRFLSLSGNQLSGKLPDWMFSFPLLQWLDLSGNRFVGFIPDGGFNASAVLNGGGGGQGIPSEGMIPPQLFVSASVDITGRQLELWYDLWAAPGIDLSRNELREEIPEGLVAMKGLEYLNLSCNYLVGQIPAGLGGMGRLRKLDFSHNGLSGEVPPGIAAMTELEVLNLSYIAYLDLCQQLMGCGSSQEHWQETLGYAVGKRALRMQGCQVGKWQEAIVMVGSVAGMERIDGYPLAHSVSAL